VGGVGGGGSLGSNKTEIKILKKVQNVATGVHS